jgi:PAS domain S-box-containing protein
MNDGEPRSKASLQKEISSLKATVARLEAMLAHKRKTDRGEPAAEGSFDPLLEFAPFAVEKLSDGAFLITKDGYIVYVNDAACQSLEYTREELIGMSMLRINPTLTQESWDAIWVITARDKQQAIETVHKTKDGRVFPVEVLANHVELYGKEYSCAFARDITDRKEAEAKRRQEHEFVTSVIDTAPVIVLILDPKGHITQFNKYTEEITGYGLDEVRGKDWFSIFVPRDQQERVRRRFKGVISGIETHGVVSPLLIRGGKLRDIIWYDKPLKDDEENVLGLLIIGQDITERRKMERRIRQSEKMEAIGQLAGGIAHDFNNQLTGIVGYADMLKVKGAKKLDLCQVADGILRAAERAVDLIEQLLAFSRKGMYRSQPVDLHDIIQEVVRMLERSVDKRINILTSLEAEQSYATGDPSQIQTAVLNLAINARDAMPEGGDLVFATEVVTLDSAYCERSPHKVTPGMYIQLDVTDTGVGMTKKVSSRIFEPFFTTKAPGKGTGMGLAAVYGTVKNHKGAIHVQSELGRGTKVTLYLPVTEDTLAKPAPVSDAEPLPPVSARVMLVEDEEIVRAMTVELLEQLGCQVRAVRNGREAVAAYEASVREIDVVILDFVMPEMGGKETFTRLREINPSVAVIIASGYSLEGEVQAVLDEGARDFIQKPFRAAVLARKIADIMNSKQNKTVLNS